MVGLHWRARVCVYVCVCVLGGGTTSLQLLHIQHLSWHVIPSVLALMAGGFALPVGVYVWVCMYVCVGPS